MTNNNHGNEMDDFIAEVEHSARKLLQACNKKRRDMALIKEKRANVERIKNSSKSTRKLECSKFGLRKDDKELVSPAAKAIVKKRDLNFVRDDLHHNPLYRDGMFKVHSNKEVEKSSQTYSRNEKSKILATLKESQAMLSKKKRNDRVKSIVNKHHDTTEIDWSLSIPRKKYRCEINRDGLYQQYLRDLEVERSTYREGEVYASSIKPVYQHPLIVMLKNLMAHEYKKFCEIIRRENRMKTFPVDVETIWKNTDVTTEVRYVHIADVNTPHVKNRVLKGDRDIGIPQIDSVPIYKVQELFRTHNTESNIFESVQNTKDNTNFRKGFVNDQRSTINQCPYFDVQTIVKSERFNIRRVQSSDTSELLISIFRRSSHSSSVSVQWGIEAVFVLDYRSFCLVLKESAMLHLNDYVNQKQLNLNDVEHGDNERISMKKLASSIINELEIDVDSSGHPMSLRINSISDDDYERMTSTNLGKEWYNQAYEHHTLFQHSLVSSFEYPVSSGNAYFGLKGLWWKPLSHMADITWTNSIDDFEHVEATQPIIVLKRKSNYSPMSASVALSLKTPLLAPLCMVIDKQVIRPSVTPTEQFLDEIAQMTEARKTSTLIPFVSPVDDIFISPIFVANTVSKTIRESGSIMNQEVVNDRTELFGPGGFRNVFEVEYIDTDFVTKPKSFGISEEAVTSNVARAVEPYIYLRSSICNEHLTRRRGIDDIRYLLRDRYYNKDGGKFGEYCLFVVTLKGYELKNIKRYTKFEYIRLCKAIDDKKEAAQNKEREENKLKYATRLADSKENDVLSKLKDELGVAQNYTLNMKKGQSGCKVDSQVRHFPIEANKQEMPPVSNYKNSSKRDDVLLSDAVAQPYSDNRLQSIEAIKVRYSSKNDSNTQNLARPVHIPSLPIETEIIDSSDSHDISFPFDSMFGITFFEKHKHMLDKCIGDHIFQTYNTRTMLDIIEPAKGTSYSVDDSLFKVPPQDIFVDDILADINLRIASRARREKESYRTRYSILSDDVNHILTIDDVLKKKTESDSKFENECSAALAVKNGNMEVLETLLDTAGVAVDTRDEHGNTLFILSCQQGSKRFAKFLLRRGATINAQNNIGNSALHFLHAYNHIQLAKYIIGKGADDSLVNNEGLTCYEGIDMSVLDEL